MVGCRDVGFDSVINALYSSGDGVYIAIDLQNY
jgi:hypothetical protein